MKITEEDDKFSIEAGPGFRQQATDYARARFQMREITRRWLIFAVTLITIASGIWIVFAPPGREKVAYLATPIILVLALGAIGIANRFVIATPIAKIEVHEEKDGNAQAQ